MAKHCCQNCVYATRPEGHWLRIILSRWAGLLICCNYADSPGRMQGVVPGGTCRNFRVRRKASPRMASRRSPDGQIAYIGLTKGKVAIVDAADFDWLNRYQWSAYERDGRFYARRRCGKHTVLMHRQIMQPPPGFVVDHIDGNGLNDRRGNLRICTPRQNAFNCRPPRHGPRFRGVTPCGDYWFASISHDGQTYDLGLFDDEIEAALARDKMARQLHGEFAYLNFPDPTPGRHND